MHSLPIFVRLEGRAVILLGDGAAADAKRRLLERAGAVPCGEDGQASLAIVAIDDEVAAVAAVTRLRARGILVNAVDRPALCDFTLPAIIDRDPVIVAIGSGGASAGLAKALRQRLEALLPQSLGALAQALHGARDSIRGRWPDADVRRRAIDVALDQGGALDPFATPDAAAVTQWVGDTAGESDEVKEAARPVLRLLAIHSADPDDLSLRQARLLSRADRIYHRRNVPPAILARARADAARIACDAVPDDIGPGLSIDLGWSAR